MLLLPASHRRSRLSRADAVAQALGIEPDGQARAWSRSRSSKDASPRRKPTRCPTSRGTRFAVRSRDPGLLNSPNFDEFPPEFRDALRPLPGNRVLDERRTSGRRSSASSWARRSKPRASRASPAMQDMQRARQVTALDAIRAYNQLLFAMEQLRVIRTNVQSKQTHVDYARNRRTAGVATELEVLRAEVDLENARAEAMRAENEVSGARALLNTVMVRPTTTPIVPTDTLAVVPFSGRVRCSGEGSARARGPSCSCCARRSGCRACWSMSRPGMRSRASNSTARTDLPCAARTICSLRTSRDGRRPSTSRCRSSTAGARPAAWRRRARERNTVTQQIAALESQVRLEVQIGARRARAGGSHDSGGRAQRHPGTPRERDDRGELQARRGDAARRGRRAAVAAAGREHPQSGAVYARECARRRCGS